MGEGRKVVEIDLPELEANEMSARAAMEGVTSARFMGAYTLKGFYGAMHSEVRAFEHSPNRGQIGTKKDGDLGDSANSNPTEDQG